MAYLQTLSATGYVSAVLFGALAASGGSWLALRAVGEPARSVSRSAGFLAAQITVGLAMADCRATVFLAGGCGLLEAARTAVADLVP